MDFEVDGEKHGSLARVISLNHSKLIYHPDREFESAADCGVNQESRIPHTRDHLTWGKTCENRHSPPTYLSHLHILLLCVISTFINSPCNPKPDHWWCSGLHSRAASDAPVTQCLGRSPTARPPTNPLLLPRTPRRPPRRPRGVDPRTASGGLGRSRLSLMTHRRAPRPGSRQTTIIPTCAIASTVWRWEMSVGRAWKARPS